MHKLLVCQSQAPWKSLLDIEEVFCTFFCDGVELIALAYFLRPVKCCGSSRRKCFVFPRCRLRLFATKPSISRRYLLLSDPTWYIFVKCFSVVNNYVPMTSSVDFLDLCFSTEYCHQGFLWCSWVCQVLFGKPWRTFTKRKCHGLVGVVRPCSCRARKAIAFFV